MTKGRINSDASMVTAARVFQAAGESWAVVEKVAHRNDRGVHVVRLSDLERARVSQD